MKKMLDAVRQRRIFGPSNMLRFSIAVQAQFMTAAMAMAGISASGKDGGIKPMFYDLG